MPAQPQLDVVRRETVVDSCLAYGPGSAVRVRVIRREQRLTVTDDAAAIARAGRPAGWRIVAERLAREADVNISRQGAVWLPVVPVGPSLERVQDRIAQASLAFYQELLDRIDE